ncbi:hypothetical protein Purlil1_13699 [Purpureocillium lilacinum]|uniref:Uncharacterized protein n=1 Tax=Purpureocillium lilacinum TaxID=33203 RepID=A0ABR0BDE2_PURLI|nr:hypothetical protein Purlil1_13699 [Purpureocillium lilacinum]
MKRNTNETAFRTRSASSTAQHSLHRGSGIDYHLFRSHEGRCKSRSGGTRNYLAEDPALLRSIIAADDSRQSLRRAIVSSLFAAAPTFCPTRRSPGRDKLKPVEFAASKERITIASENSSNALSNISATPNTTSTKSTGPYDRAFQQHLIDHDIFPHGYEYPNRRLPPEPDNIDELRQILAAPRGSLSLSKFTSDNFRKFERADTHTAKERDVTVTVIPIIEGNAGDRKCVAGQIPFTNLGPLTDGTLAPGNPDLYYGARPEQLKRTARNELNKMVVPSTQQELPIVPNFSLAGKEPAKKRRRDERASSEVSQLNSVQQHYFSALRQQLAMTCFQRGRSH